MKGTIDATRPEAEKELMENKKEAAEHATIVDLIRNDLSIIAEQVQWNATLYRPSDNKQGWNPADKFGDYRTASHGLSQERRYAAFPFAPCWLYYGVHLSHVPWR